MSMFEPSKWKVGQPLLRVLVLLLAPVAMSYVMGACTKHRPLPGEQAAGSQSTSYHCDGGTALSAGDITYTPSEPDAGFEPDELCLKPGASLKLHNRDTQKLTLCFRRELPDGGPADETPFEDGGTRIIVPSQQKGQDPEPLHKKLRGNNEGWRYVFSPASPDGGCRDTYGGGMVGTLEVGTSGTGEPPEEH